MRFLHRRFVWAAPLPLSHPEPAATRVAGRAGRAARASCGALVALVGGVYIASAEDQTSPAPASTPKTCEACANWKWSLGGAWAWQDVDGSEDTFRSQYDLREGFMLDGLTLDYTGGGALERFTFDARGFGQAWPTQTARARFRLRDDVEIFADYDRREGFFALAAGDLALRQDDTEISRFKAGVSLDAGKALRTSFIVRRYETEGQISRPLYGLNELYPVTTDLDETMTEGVVRLESLTLPVRLVFEQAFARYSRNNRREPADPEALSGADPDLLLEASTDFDDTQDVPTSRLTVGYSSPAFEGFGTVLYSAIDLDATGVGTTDFAVNGGATGRITFVNDQTNSAATDSLYAASNLGFRLTPALTLRVTTAYRDAVTDTEWVGRRLLRGTSPGGIVVEFPAAIDENGRYTFEDSDGRVRLEYRKRTWAAWAGVLGADRRVSWRRLTNDPTVNLERETDGFILGGSFNPSPALDLTLEYEGGDFTGEVYRTDPTTVERTTLRLRSQLARAWHLRFQAQIEESDNPPALAALQHEARPVSLAVDWAGSGGNAHAGIDLQRFDLSTDTGIVLPGGAASTSLYDLDLVTATLYGDARWGAFRLDGAVTWLEDDGTSFPLQSWNARVRLEVQATRHITYGLFAERWSYNEELATPDDYDTTRGGLSLVWRSE